MKHVMCLAVMVVLCGCVTAAKITPPTSRPITSIPTSDLIDRLTLVSNDEFALRTNIIAVGEHGDEPMPQGLLKLQDVGPKSSEVMDELVRRGVNALPELLAHLDDPRKTKALIERMITLWYTPRYDRQVWTDVPVPSGVFFDWDGNFRNPDLKPRPSTRPGDGGFVEEENQSAYVPAVGDVCFNLIGQIVNRDFQAIAYIPSGNVYVSSPVLFPDLAAAVRKEWSGLTAKKLQQSLIADVVSPDRLDLALNALPMLAKLDPDAVADAVKRRLALPEYDRDGAVDLVREMDHERDLADGMQAMQEFMSRSPHNRDGLVLELWEYRNADGDPDPASTKVTKRTLLSKLVPKIDENFPPRVTSVSPQNTRDFLHAVVAVRSPAVEDVVWQAFVARENIHDAKIEAGDEFALDYIDRFASPVHRDDLLKFCQQRQRELSDSDDKASYQTMIDMLNGTGKPPQHGLFGSRE